MLNKAGHMFADRNAPAPIVRCDFIVNHPYLDDLGEDIARSARVSRPLALALMPS